MIPAISGRRSGSAADPQAPEPLAHPLGALGGAGAAVQVQITDVGEYEHGAGLPKWINAYRGSNH